MSEVRVGSSEVRVSATEELRRMLDERGVKWTNPNSCLRDEMTSWAAGGFYYEAFEVPDPEGMFLLTAAHQDDLTPAQAIDATLGRGMCKNVGYYIDSTRFKCSACGYNGWTKYAADGKDRVPRYCPNCGCKVVDA